MELLARTAIRPPSLRAGQSLVPVMNLRLANPELVVDINGLAELEAAETGVEATGRD